MMPPVEKLYTDDEVGCEAVNLGTGNGVSASCSSLMLWQGSHENQRPRVVLETSHPYNAAAATAENLLKCLVKLGVDGMFEDTWRWQSPNPYEDKVVQEDQE
jgi:hypothetical protein